MKRIKFSRGELLALTESPEAIRALAHQHDIWEIEVDAIGYVESAAHHAQRAKELREQANIIEAAHNNGDDVKFDEGE